MNIRVICVDASNQPKEIPKNKQVVFMEKYTINKVFRSYNPKTRGVLGVSLNEIDISDCKPYEFFKYSRFKVLDSDELLLDKIEQEIKLEDLVII